MKEPQVKEKELKMVWSAVQHMLHDFWLNGGKEKYEATKEMRDANGIPDSQWFKANLMSIIDDAEITFESE